MELSRKFLLISICIIFLFLFFPLGKCAYFVDDSSPAPTYVKYTKCENGVCREALCSGQVYSKTICLNGTCRDYEICGPEYSSLSRTPPPEPMPWEVAGYPTPVPTIASLIKTSGESYSDFSIVNGIILLVSAILLSASGYYFVRRRTGQNKFVSTPEGNSVIEILHIGDSVSLTGIDFSNSACFHDMAKPVTHYCPVTKNAYCANCASPYSRGYPCNFCEEYCKGGGLIILK